MYGQSLVKSATLSLTASAATGTTTDATDIRGCNKVFVKISSFASACPVVVMAADTATSSSLGPIMVLHSTGTAQVATYTIASTGENGDSFFDISRVAGLPYVGFAVASMPAVASTLTVYKSF